MLTKNKQKTYMLKTEREIKFATHIKLFNVRIYLFIYFAFVNTIIVFV